MTIWPEKAPSWPQKFTNPLKAPRAAGPARPTATAQNGPKTPNTKNAAADSQPMHAFASETVIAT